MKDKVTLERVYRKILALEKSLADQIALNRLDIEVQSANITALRGTLRPIVGHCERLLREKEILMRDRNLREANEFMAKPLEDAIGTKYTRDAGEAPEIIYYDSRDRTPERP